VAIANLAAAIIATAVQEYGVAQLYRLQKLKVGCESIAQRGLSPVEPYGTMGVGIVVCLAAFKRVPGRTSCRSSAEIKNSLYH
jgi:hypothetical protein